MKRLNSKTKQLIRSALREDLGKGDVTSDLFIQRGELGSATINAKANGICSGLVIAKEVFRAVDPKISIQLSARDGAKIKKGRVVLRAKGRLASILKAERTTLNFLGHLSGIATLTHLYTSQVKGTGARILDTRKTTPLLRALEKAAVKDGGGTNHRFGLYDEILMKENHWASVRRKYKSGAEAFTAKQLKRKKIPSVIEVRNLREFKRLLASKAKPNRVLLDNFSTKQLRAAVKLSRGNKNLLLEASGGVTLKSVRAIAHTGVDLISVGAITHSAPSFDYSLIVKSS